MWRRPAPAMLAIQTAGTGHPEARPETTLQPPPGLGQYGASILKRYNSSMSINLCGSQ